MTKGITEGIFEVEKKGFLQKAIEIFRFQYDNNELYRSYTNQLGIEPGKVRSLVDIPFLPIGFFKTRSLQTTPFEPEAVFESSGTTQTTSSRHLVRDIGLYERSFLTGFERFYGNAKGYCIIGLLPSYLQRSNSSLVFMVNSLIERSGDPRSGFYLDEYEQLHELLKQLEIEKVKTLLIGVTFALLDFSERFQMNLKHTIIMETGGMKGRRKEITRQELHAQLQQRLSVADIHAEYGMTELLSQAYSGGQGVFECVPWLKVLVRNEDDPFDVAEAGDGIFNIIDLANVYSCSFIATDDVGRVFEDGRFEVVGRVDNSDMRGCSLLVV